MAKVYQTSKARSGRGSVSPTPAAPVAVTATLTQANEITLSWQDPSDNTALQKYNIYRSTGGGYSYIGEKTPVAYPSSQTYVSGALADATYTYQVSCVSLGGVESAKTTSNSLVVTNPPPQVTFGWKSYVTEPYSIGTFTQGAANTYPLLPLVDLPSGTTATFTKTSSTDASITVGSSDGIIQIPSSLTAGNYSVTVALAAADVGITSATQVLSEVTLSEPAAGASVTDTTFGVGITKIVNPAALTGAFGQEAQPFYANLRAWNSNGTLLVISTSTGADPSLSGGFAAILDASTYEVRVPLIQAVWPDTAYLPRWSPTEPYVLYYVGTSQSHTGPVVWKCELNPTTWARTWTVAGNFPTLSSSSVSAYAQEAWHNIRVHPTTGHLWMPCCFRSGSSTGYVSFAYNLTTQTPSAFIDVASLSGSGTGRSGETNVTPDCDGVILGFGVSGTGPSGFMLFDLSGNFVRTIANSQGHYDIVKDTAGNSWIIYANSNGGVSRSQINGGSSNTSVMLNLAPQQTTGLQSGLHVSARALSGYTSDANQFVVVNRYGDNPVAAVPMASEIFLLYMDSTAATPHVLRLCHHRSVGVEYSNDMPFATVNNNGTKILFGSNWGGTYKDAYTVDVP